MSVVYWDESDLKALNAGGLVREDVMDQIWDISDIPLPFMETAGRGQREPVLYGMDH